MGWFSGSDKDKEQSKRDKTSRDRTSRDPKTSKEIDRAMKRGDVKGAGEAVKRHVDKWRKDKN